ncbi:MAG TPA: hypothetical protein VMV46_16265, partial [Thermoanaerobaculia bacterium]|nr:hypothetical protein [Thermoanaerobaculia bacterium]
MCGRVERRPFDRIGEKGVKPSGWRHGRRVRAWWLGAALAAGGLAAQSARAAGPEIRGAVRAPSGE